MKKITIYSPRAWTRKLHDNDKRWKIIIAHRRSGKTTATLNHLVRDAMKVKKSKYAFIAPTYKQAKNVAWDIIKEATKKIDGVIFNESELRVNFINGSKIILYGSDNPDALRGMALWGVIFDEYSQQPQNIFTEIIRPALTDHKGYAIWIGTPKGKNAFYNLYQYAKTDKKWLTMLLSVDDTGLIDKEELKDAKAVMPEEEFQQEFYCSFEAPMQGSYYGKLIQRAEKEKRILNLPCDENIKVNTWWDLGIGDSTTIWFTQDIGNTIRVIDCYENSGEGLAFYVNILDKKREELNYIYGSHNAPHDIEVRELGTGKSRYEVAAKLGVRFNVVKKISIEDGINAVRGILNRCWFDEEKCKAGLNALRDYHKEWDDKRQEFKARPYHDWSSHFSDAFRYLAVGHREIQQRVKEPEELYNKYELI